ncbi:MAG: Gfo/Idh/MocA family oxidoreductase [Pirellulales bacterium]|nr:Gfo/Idh/MocA family oxidoreductase [Pirellulales bacterium]
MLTSSLVSRRDFVKSAAAGAAGVAAAQVVPAAALGKDGAVPPSERIAVGLIGCGGMGRSNLHNCAQYKDVVAAAACDVWKTRLDDTMAVYKETAKPYRDYRELLAQKDIDGVIVATPPHWHCRIAVDAAEAGKDIYLQKPMTLHLAESLAVKNAVRKHGRVCQVGTQIHAGENYRRVVEWIRSGKLGKISVARTFMVMNQGPEGIGMAENGDPPREIDWDFWLGPCSMRPFNPLIVQNSYQNGSFMAYSGGWTPGMAPHIIDLPVWALELGYPTVTYSSGGRYTIEDAGDAPDAQEIVWQYPNFTMNWSMSLTNSFCFDFGRGAPARRLGIYFHGLRGTLFCDYGKHQVVPEGKLLADANPPEKNIPPSPGHEREWLDCIKNRRQPSCNPEYHAKIDVPIVLANLSLALGRSIRFDGAAEMIIGDPEAARLSKPEYRAPWTFPDEYLNA